MIIQVEYSLGNNIKYDENKSLVYNRYYEITFRLPKMCYNKFSFQYLINIFKWKLFQFWKPSKLQKNKSPTTYRVKKPLKLNL